MGNSIYKYLYKVEDGSYKGFHVVAEDIEDAAKIAKKYIEKQSIKARINQITIIDNEPVT